MLLRPVHRVHFHAPGVARALFWAALGRPVSDALAGVDVVHYSGAGREMHVLCRPVDRRPFVLSLLRQRGLIKHHWFNSVLAVLAILAVGILILWSLTVRLPW